MPASPSSRRTWWMPPPARPLAPRDDGGPGDRGRPPPGGHRRGPPPGGGRVGPGSRGGATPFPPILDRLGTWSPISERGGADLVIVAAHSGFEGTSYDMEVTGLGPENQMARWPGRSPGSTPSSWDTRTARSPTRCWPGCAWPRQGPTPARSPRVEFRLAQDAEGRWEVRESEGRLLRPDPPDRGADPAMEEILASAHARTLAQVNRVVAASPSRGPPTGPGGATLLSFAG
jgi:hypothetical protein